MQLKTLGGLKLEGADFKQQKPLLLLCYLALEGQQPRRHIAELLWPRGADPLKNLTTVLARLRKTLGEVLGADQTRTWVSLRCDAKELLETLETQADAETLDAYEGMFLAGFNIKDISIELEEWVYATREYIAHQVRQALLIFAEQRLKDNPLQASHFAKRAYYLAGAAEPSPEQYQQLYHIFKLSGSPYAEEVHKEADVFGIVLEKPKQRAIQKQDPSQSGSSSVSHNLTKRLDPFVGRKADLAELKTLVRQEDTKLLTLLGVGGTGKTSLATELLQSFYEEQQFTGLYFISLEAVNSEPSILTTIASNLVFPLQVQESVLEQLKAFLHDKDYLLVLDNFEHLIAHAAFLTDLLTSCPELKILVTSRERLNLSAELVYPVLGLELPLETDSFKRAKERDAIELFIKRAKVADLRFSPDNGALAAIIEICTLVKGLPLGIELAAAWVKLVALDEILTKIKSNFDFLASSQQDTIERHRSLRAVFEHSWALLQPKEQQALKQLSVFRGSFKREAAREVTGVSIPILAALTDKSLLTVINFRFDMHPLIWQYSFEKLNEDQEQAWQSQEKHALYFLNLVQAHTKDYYSLEELDGLDQLELELENVWAALGWAKNNNLPLGLNLCISLESLWHDRGYCPEGYEKLSQLLTHFDSNQENLLYANALHTLGKMAAVVDTIENAKSLYEQSLQVYQAIDHQRGVAKAYISLGSLYSGVRQTNEAADYLEKARALYLALGDDYGASEALNELGINTVYQRKLELASPLFEQSLALKHKINDFRGIARLTNNMAAVYHSRTEDQEKALSHYKQALKLYQQSGNKRGAMIAQSNIADTLIDQAHYSDAKPYFASVVRFHKESGDRRHLQVTLNIILRLFCLEAKELEVAVIIAAAMSLAHDTIELSKPAQEQYSNHVKRLKQDLPDELFNQLWIKGMNMQPSELISFIIGHLETAAKQ